MKTVRNFIALLTICLLLLSLISCKRTYFRMAEEVTGNKAVRFTVKQAYYQPGQSIALTHGGYELRSSDSSLLFISGEAPMTEVGEKGVASLQINQTTRMYLTLPYHIRVGKYELGQKSIAEVLNSLNYPSGDNLFVCRSGVLVVDSLRGSKIYGHFNASFLNSSGRNMNVDGTVKAGRK